MKRTILFLVTLAAVGLLFGCSARDSAPEPVTHAPAWTAAPTVPETSEPEVLIHMDLTMSMLGFSGRQDSAISRTLLALTNQARFEPRWSTWLLEPDSDRDLQWESCNPLLLSSAMLNTKDDSSYTTSGDFDVGGPVYSLFSRQPDPDQTYVLITDLLEQEGQINAVHTYTRELFRAESHQQLYIAIADSHFDGTVSFPKIEDERFWIKSCSFQGERPFAVIVAGPKSGVQAVRSILLDAGVDFGEFLVENRRDPGISITMQPAQILTRNILIEDLTQAHCTIDLAPMQKIENGYIHQKVSANHARSCQLALQTPVQSGLELQLEQLQWLHWEQLPEDPEPDAQTAPTEAVQRWDWVPCEAPVGASVELRRVAPGKAIAGQDAAHSGLQDLAVPRGQALQEFRLLLEEPTAGSAYALQANLMARVNNPLASSAPFAKWDISFALYGRADKDPSILKRIPDLELFLDALTGLDADQTHAAVGQIRLVIQNYS